ncbi:CPBP family intramembrane glutamic endopeptidase [Haloparvum sp. PAK95]|uniref:CPBP family intramembrane glutamic endopeptidase n=1 Tax=Haloparvum sp. PAK95 TaxID=3418962 RepID=UPI003D2F17A1
MDPLGAFRRTVWASDERRPRMPVRLLLTGVVFVFVSVALATAVRVVGIGGSEAGAYAAIVRIGLSGLVVTAIVLVPCGRFLDRRRLRDFGLRLDRDWWVDCAFGLALGAGLQAAVFGVGWLAGWFRVTAAFVSDGSFAVGFASVLVLFLSVGIYEELVARGWLLTNLAEGLRFAGETIAVAVAVAVSAGVFGVAHAVNPGATTLSTGIISLAGVFLALGYVLTGELAIPIGVHVTWNLFQGAVFGFGVSGLSLPATVLETEPTGPKLLTGGSFGPEAGVLGLAAIVVGCGATVGWVWWRTGSVGIHPRVTAPELVTDVDPEQAAAGDAGAETATVDDA